MSLKQERKKIIADAKDFVLGGHLRQCLEMHGHVDSKVISKIVDWAAAGGRC